MATISHHQSDIELENTVHNTTGTLKSNTPMPRLDMCHNCGKSHSMHANGKCLFESSTFKPVDQDPDSFRRDFLQWAAGQKIEECFCRIVYELTRRDQ